MKVRILSGGTNQESKLADIPAKGGKTLQLLDTVKEEASRIQITENGIETPFYRISTDENGSFHLFV